MSTFSTTYLHKFLNYRTLFALLILLYIGKVLSIGEGDFSVYYGAANDIRQSKPIYFVAYGEADFAYSYSPFFAMLLIPLATLPLAIADMFWLMLSAVLLFRVFHLVALFLDTDTVLTAKNHRLWVFLTLLFTTRFILYNFDTSQITIVLLWGCLESLNLIIKDRPVLGSFILAVVISVKLLPLVLLPYLFYRKFFSYAK